MGKLIENLSSELSELVDRAGSSLLHIYTETAAGRTGFRISEKQAITVAMRADLGEKVDVIDRKSSVSSATVAGFDETSGIVLLDLDDDTGEEAPFSSGAGGELPSVGSLAITAAFPSRQGVEARFEMIRCVAGPTRLPAGKMLDSYIQTDGMSYPGFLGAPLFSAKDEVIGVALAAGRRSENLYMSSKELSALIDILRKHKRIVVGYLGVRGQSATLERDVKIDDTGYAAGTNPGENGGSYGFLVTDVEPESPAEKAGVRASDILITVDGKRTDSIESLLGALIGPVERAVEIRIARGDSDISLTAELVERPYSKHGSEPGTGHDRGPRGRQGHRGRPEHGDPHDHGGRGRHPGRPGGSRDPHHPGWIEA